MELVPTNALRLALRNAMAADAASIAPAADACQAHLIVEDFTPDASTSFTDLDEATFAGGAAKAAGLGAQGGGQNPQTGDRVIVIDEPALGWIWNCTADIDPGEMVHGVAFTNLLGTVTWATGKFDTPVLISKAGQFVNAGDLRLTATDAIMKAV